MATSLETLTEMVELSEQLLAGRETMLEPQDLPGRFGRAVRAVDHVIQVMQSESVLAGGWAVWRHGFDGRVTQDVDIVLPADRIDEFLRCAGVSGFEILPQKPGRWPKVRHKETGVKVDVLPEGARPGTASAPAPTTIPHPAKLGGKLGALRYISLPALIELKLAAGRGKDEADIMQLILANPAKLAAIRAHLATVHPDYVQRFDALILRAPEEEER
jgi:hypothetical protein